MDFQGIYGVGRKQIVYHAGLGADLRGGFRFEVGRRVFLGIEGDLGLVSARSTPVPVNSLAAFESKLFAGPFLPFRYGLGGRFGLELGRLEPSVYLFGGGFTDVGTSGWGVRTGGALDVRIASFLSLGAHVDGNFAGWSEGRADYVGFGGHVGFVL